MDAPIPINYPSVQGSVSFVQSDGGPFRLHTSARVPIRLDTSGRGPHAIGRSMGWTESWTLSDN